MALAHTAERRINIIALVSDDELSSPLGGGINRDGVDRCFSVPGYCLKPHRRLPSPPPPPPPPPTSNKNLKKIKRLPPTFDRGKALMSHLQVSCISQTALSPRRVFNTAVLDTHTRPGLQPSLDRRILPLVSPPRSVAPPTMASASDAVSGEERQCLRRADVTGY